MARGHMRPESRPSCECQGPLPREKERLPRSLSAIGNPPAMEAPALWLGSATVFNTVLVTWFWRTAVMQAGYPPVVWLSVRNCPTLFGSETERSAVVKRPMVLASHFNSTGVRTIPCHDVLPEALSVPAPNRLAAVRVRHERSPLARRAWHSE